MKELKFYNEAFYLWIGSWTVRLEVSFESGFTHLELNIPLIALTQFIVGLWSVHFY